MNKAQKDYVEAFYASRTWGGNLSLSLSELKYFAGEYGAINSEPDNLYVMMYKGLSKEWHPNHPETFTKEEADKKLHNLMTESLDYVSEYRAGEYLKLFFPKEENSQEWTQEFRIDLA